MTSAADLALAYQSQGKFAESEALAHEALEFHRLNNLWMIVPPRCERNSPIENRETGVHPRRAALLFGSARSGRSSEVGPADAPIEGLSAVHRGSLSVLLQPLQRASRLFTWSLFA